MVVRVGSSHLRGEEGERTSGRSPFPGTGIGGAVGARGGARRPRRSGRARRGQATARRPSRGRATSARGCGPPVAGVRGRRPSPAAATPPGTAAAHPLRRTRGDTAWSIRASLRSHVTVRRRSGARKH